MEWLEPTCGLFFWKLYFAVNRSEGKTKGMNMKNGLHIILMVLVMGVTVFAESYIQVVCEPGVKIFLDGTFKGISNADDSGLIIENLVPGTYEVKAVRTGFASQQSRLIVAEKDVKNWTLRPFVQKEQVSQKNIAQMEAIEQQSDQNLPLEQQLQVHERKLLKQIKKLATTLANPPADMKMAEVTTILNDKKKLEGQLKEVRLKKVRLQVVLKGEEEKRFYREYTKYRTIVESEELNDTLKAMAWKELCGKWDVDPGEKPGVLVWNMDKDTVELFVPPEFTVVCNVADIGAALRADGGGLILKIDATTWKLEKGQHYTLEISKKGYMTRTEKIYVNWAGQREREVVLEKSKNMVVGLGGGVGMKMIWIKSGSFQMGATTGNLDETPEHSVTLSEPFWLARTEVTQAQYRKIMNHNPSDFKDDLNPVEKVSWNDAMEFCRKLTELERQAGSLPEGYEYSLPTEAQWEYACRAGTTGKYAGDLDAMAWNSSNSGKKAHSVGKKQPNAWGLYDMHGNVWEWCLDCYGDGYYGKTPACDPVNTGKGSNRVSRGGCWSNFPGECRSANRNWIFPSFTYNYLGFRVCLVCNAG